MHISWPVLPTADDVSFYVITLSGYCVTRSRSLGIGPSRIRLQ